MQIEEIKRSIIDVDRLSFIEENTGLYAYTYRAVIDGAEIRISEDRYKEFYKLLKEKKEKQVKEAEMKGQKYDENGQTLLPSPTSSIIGGLEAICNNMDVFEQIAKNRKAAADEYAKARLTVTPGPGDLTPASGKNEELITALTRIADQLTQLNKNLNNKKKRK